MEQETYWPHRSPGKHFQSINMTAHIFTRHGPIRIAIQKSFEISSYSKYYSGTFCRNAICLIKYMLDQSRNIYIVLTIAN